MEAAWPQSAPAPWASQRVVPMLSFAPGTPPDVAPLIAPWQSAEVQCRAA
ncbi:hypothetical protein GCM10023321_50650 [Pseudonocardia eucalypti]|uniref:Uncharacterized protein n=1 Tax=Pseudonocardia eucalypti TaxID=648755 RepID=A0ABP9QKT9_9PSEU